MTQDKGAVTTAETPFTACHAMSCLFNNDQVSTASIQTDPPIKPNHNRETSFIVHWITVNENMDQSRAEIVC